MVWRAPTLPLGSVPPQLELCSLLESVVLGDWGLRALLQGAGKGVMAGLLCQGAGVWGLERHAFFQDCRLEDGQETDVVCDSLGPSGKTCVCDWCRTEI